MSAVPFAPWLKTRHRRRLGEGPLGGDDRGPQPAALAVKPPSRHRSRSGLFGALLIGLFVFLAFAAPYLTVEPGPEDLDGFRSVGPANAFDPHPPSKELPLGGDPGRAGQWSV